MEIGYVLQKEYKKGEEVIKWFELSVRVPFGSCTLTMAKRKPRDGDAENAPDFELWFSPNRKGESFDRMKAGSLWTKISEKGNKYLSGYIESPLVTNGKMYISIVKYVHQEGMVQQPYLYKVLWTSPQTSNRDTQGDNYGHGGGYSENGYISTPTQTATQPTQEHGGGYSENGYISTPTQTATQPTQEQGGAIPATYIEEDEIPFNQGIA